MRSRVHVTVQCLSVRQSVSLSHLSTATAACGGFAAGRLAGCRHRSTAAGARQHGASCFTAFSRKCEQCHVYSRRRRLNTDLLRTELGLGFRVRLGLGVRYGEQMSVMAISEGGASVQGSK